MPNHVHLLLRIAEDGSSGTPTPTVAGDGSSGTKSPANARLPMFVSTWKRFSNQRCGSELWQRSFHEHVIRGAEDYAMIWDYIEKNPAKWAEDRYYTE